MTEKIYFFVFGKNMTTPETILTNKIKTTSIFLFIITFEHAS